MLCLTLHRRKSEMAVRRCSLRLRLEKRLHLSKAKSELSLCIRFARSLTYWYNENNADLDCSVHFLMVWTFHIRRSADCRNLPCCDSTAVLFRIYRVHMYVHYLSLKLYLLWRRNRFGRCSRVAAMWTTISVWAQRLARRRTYLVWTTKGADMIREMVI